MRITNSGFRGVHFYKPTMRWIAYVSINSRKIHLGYFVNLMDAIEARRKANKEKESGNFKGTIVVDNRRK